MTYRRRTPWAVRLAANVEENHPGDETDFEPRDAHEPTMDTTPTPGPVNLLGALDNVLQFRAALEAAGDEHHVCDECTGLYDAPEGCVHSRNLCAQCLHRCPECRFERREDEQAQTAMDVARDWWSQ